MVAFGKLLKDWRTKKRFSQMALGLEANVSARHLSYLETGKAKPSKEMVLQLADTLTVPAHARNQWLISAGYAPAYQRRPLDDIDLKPFMQVAQRLLDHHAPFPGWVLDGTWKVVLCNVPGQRLFEHIGLSVGDNLLGKIALDPTFGGKLVNWKEVVAHLSNRVMSDGIKREDPATKAFATMLAQSQTERPPEPNRNPAIPTILELDGSQIVLTSVQAMFNTAEDLTLRDLRTELFFPVDPTSETCLKRLLR